MPPVDPVEITRSLVRCATVTPDAGAALDLLQKWLSGSGFACRRLVFDASGTPSVDNLVATWGSGTPHLVFNGHVDVVPPGPVDRWSHRPFEGVIDDGFLYGRGSVDMKSGIAAFLSAVCELVAQRWSDPGTITLAITGDEEGPAQNGSVRLFEWCAREGYKFDACLVGEPTSVEVLGDMAKVGRRGSFNGVLTIEGVQGHTAYPHAASNAAHAMVRALSALLATPIDRATEDFDPSDLQVTSIDIGNAASNVIPGNAQARFNIRYNDLQTKETLDAWLAARLRTGDSAWTLQTQSSGDAFRGADPALQDVLADAVEHVCGHRPVMSTSGGTSDARFARHYCPTIEFGLTSRSMHAIDERVAIAEIRQLALVYKRFVQQFVRQPGSR